MVSLGGWKEGSARFSMMVADPVKMENFIQNLVQFLRENRFDGVDLAWQYPAFREGNYVRDKINYSKFIQVN
jgi:GH18 family chitinase